MMNITPVVKQLIIINIIFFIGSQIVPDGYAYDLFSLHFPESNDFKIWQIITHMFMHARWPDFMHILFNMYGLYLFGTALEHYWGAKRFIFFYIVCGLGAALAQLGVYYFQLHEIYNSISNLNLSHTELNTILNADFKNLFDEKGQMIQGNIKTILDHAHCTQPQFNKIVEAKSIYQSTMVGASGAIYGLLAAFAFMFPDAGLMLIFIPYPIKAKYFVPVLVLLDLFSGVTGFSIFGGGIAHFAHVGGALVGLILMLIWRNNKYNHNRWN